MPSVHHGRHSLQTDVYSTTVTSENYEARIITFVFSFSDHSFVGSGNTGSNSATVSNLCMCPRHCPRSTQITGVSNIHTTCGSEVDRILTGSLTSESVRQSWPTAGTGSVSLYIILLFCDIRNLGQRLCKF
jgi:hypothetical protein